MPTLEYTTRSGIHVTRKFWWELIFISVLVFLFTSNRLQMKRDLIASAPPDLAPVITLEVAVNQPAIPLAVN